MGRMDCCLQELFSRKVSRHLIPRWRLGGLSQYSLQSSPTKSLTSAAHFTLLFAEAQSFKDLFHNQVTLLRLMPRLGLDAETSMDLLCLAGSHPVFRGHHRKEAAKCSRLCDAMGLLLLPLFQVSIDLKIITVSSWGYFVGVGSLYA